MRPVVPPIFDPIPIECFHAEFTNVLIYYISRSIPKIMKFKIMGLIYELRACGRIRRIVSSEVNASSTRNSKMIGPW